MSGFRTEETRTERTGLRYKLLIVEVLTFVLPVLTLCYFLFGKGFSFNSLQAIIFSLILVLILAGFLILRHIFEKFISLSVLIKKAQNDKTAELDMGKDTAELHDISISFNNLMREFEQSTDELRRRVFELFAIKEIIEIASKSLDMDDLLNALLDKTMAVSTAQFGSVYLVESETQRFRVVGSRGFEQGPQKNSHININDSLARLVVSSKEPLLVQNIETDPRTRKPNDPKYGPPSFLSMPIFVGKELAAVLNLSNKASGAVFDHNDDQVLAIMIGEISFALENALLHSRVEDHLKLLQEQTHELEQEVLNRKRAEEALREREAQYKSIFNSATDAFLIFDSSTRVVEANPQACKTYGYSKNEFMKIAIKEIVCSDSHQLFEQFQRDIKEKGEIQAELINVRKDGTTFTVEIRGTEIDYKGKKHLLAIIRDVTERKKMAEELLKVQKLESIGFLAGGIAHDFSNALTGVLGNITLARMFVKPEEKIYKQLEKAEKASYRAKELTQQLVTFAKGGTPIKKTVSISKLLKNALNFPTRRLEVKCEFSLPDDLWPVEVDESQISRVIDNIGINADQAMPEGGIIWVKAENMNANPENGGPLQNGRYVKITIEDQGVGIPQGDLNKIFDPFFTTKKKGNGLGLATAYSIIRKHNGCITVDSEPGRGTSFAVYLPASEKQIRGKRNGKRKSVMGKKSILVMDDEEMVRDIAGEMLETIGYEVEFAKDGVEAIEAYKKALDDGRLFEAVILDLTISEGMGGKETIRRLREIDPKIKAIVSSGYSHDPIMAEYKENGFSGVIVKPYRIEELDKTLHKVVTEMRV